MLFPEVRESAIEVIAYLVSGNSNQEQVRVAASPQSNNKDSSGNFRLRVPLVMEGRATIVGGEVAAPREGEQHRELRLKTHLRRFRPDIVIPYADFSIQPGKHKIGYEARLVVDGRLVDAQPTSLTLVTVTDKAREIPSGTMMLVSPGQPDRRPLTRTGEGLFWHDGKLISRTYRFRGESLSYLCDAPLLSSTVKIPGEFNRAGLDGNGGAARPTAQFVPEPRRTIFFATNREVLKPDSNAAESFGDESVLAVDKMTYGSCVVSIPVDHHRPGDIEQPGRWWCFWTENPDPNKHFLIEKFKHSIGFDEFKSALGKDDVLVYVHGYRNSFKDSILRSAQLQHDLEFGGKMLTFSWPSAGTVEGYGHDERTATHSHAFLAALFDQLLNRQTEGTSRRKVHVIAHSMGSRVLLNALYDLAGRLRRDGPKLGQVILAAADVDGVDYANARSALLDCAERVTYYFASDDAALLASRVAHAGKEPIGVKPVFDKDRMDTISADSLTSVFNNLGHLYVSTSRAVLTDIRLILSRGLPPLERRPPLGPRIEDRSLMGNFYYTFLLDR